MNEWVKALTFGVRGCCCLGLGERETRFVIRDWRRLQKEGNDRFGVMTHGPARAREPPRFGRETETKGWCISSHVQGS